MESIRNLQSSDYLWKVRSRCWLSVCDSEIPKKHRHLVTVSRRKSTWNISLCVSTPNNTQLNLGDLCRSRHNFVVLEFIIRTKLSCRVYLQKAFLHFIPSQYIQQKMTLKKRFAVCWLFYTDGGYFEDRVCINIACTSQAMNIPWIIFQMRSCAYCSSWHFFIFFSIFHVQREKLHNLLTKKMPFNWTVCPRRHTFFQAWFTHLHTPVQQFRWG